MKLLLAASVLFGSNLVFAASGGGHGGASKHTGLPPAAALEEKPLQPATRYSGRTPIDLKNGLKMNNGTYGAPNADYEAWASQPSVVPNVSEKTYPYHAKGEFIKGVNESAEFVEHAIWNWERSIAHPTEVTKPEVLEYAKASVNTMKPILEKFKKAVSDAKGANSGSWDEAQNNARKALVELRGSYAQLHNNTH